MDHGGRGADETQPPSFFVQNNSDTMAQPPIRNMFLEAVRDGQRLDVGTLPQGVRWKNVSVSDVTRIDEPPRPPSLGSPSVLSTPILTATLPPSPHRSLSCMRYADGTSFTRAADVSVTSTHTELSIHLVPTPSMTAVGSVFAVVHTA